MKMDPGKLQVWGWRVLPILVLIIVRVIRAIAGKYIGQIWFSEATLMAGWIIGWLVVDAEGIFYAAITNPQETVSQSVMTELRARNFRKAWKLSMETSGERTKLPIRNILTAFAMTGVGIWVVSSSPSFLAAGLVFGFSVRLFSEMLTSGNFQSWYWVINREFTKSEHYGLMLAWVLILFWQWSVLSGR